MTRAGRLGALLICLLALAVAPRVHAQVPCEEWGLLARGTSGEDSGIGGTGRAEDDSGIGGTGRSGEDSGIGGTGIYGAITGFGSLCVNGLRVHYDDQTQVSLNDQLAALEALRLGQVVWVQASAQGGRLRALEIAVLSAVVGAIDDLDPEARELRVAQQRVYIPEQAIVIDELGAPLPALAELKVGEMLDVSGLRREDGVIEATRVQRRAAAHAVRFAAPPLEDLLRRSMRIETVSFEGHLGGQLGRELVRIAGLRVELGALPVPQIPAGARVWVRADVSAAGDLRAQSLVQAPIAEPLPSVPPIRTPVPAPAPREPGEPDPGSVQHRPPAKEAPSLRVTDMPELFDPPGSAPPQPPPSGGAPGVVPVPVPKLPVEPRPIEPAPIPPPRIDPPLLDVIQQPRLLEIEPKPQRP